MTVEWIAAGRYQITLSGEAWVDAVQNDRRLPMLASSSRDDCPGIRQSVQFGGAVVRRLNVAVLRVHEAP